MATRLSDAIRQDFISDTSRPLRVVSIDPGIRNFSYCVVHLEAKCGKVSDIHLQQWKRLDLTKDGSPLLQPSTPEVHGQHENDVAMTTYTPKSYAQSAYTIMQSIRSLYQPDYILIEMQRHRSFGGPSVQEWTLKVRYLEAMLWAVNQTFRSLAKGRETSQEAEMVSINPSKVVSYLDAFSALYVPEPTAQNPTVAKLTAAKKAKTLRIEATRRLCSRASDIFTTSEEVSEQLDMFRDQSDLELFARKKPLKRIKTDDLADCLAQCVSWIEWRACRSKLRHSISSSALDLSLFRPDPICLNVYNRS